MIFQKQLLGINILALSTFLFEIASLEMAENESKMTLDLDIPPLQKRTTLLEFVIWFVLRCLINGSIIFLIVYFFSPEPLSYYVGNDVILKSILSDNMP